MSELYEFWPIDMESGPLFLIFMLFISGIALGGAALVGGIFGAMLESGEAPGIAVGPVIPPGPPHAYRQPTLPQTRRRLAIGWVPQPDDAWAIAYLRDGEKGVGDALFAAATALGWITGDRTRLTITPGLLSADPLLADFQRQMGSGASTMRHLRPIALGVAKNHKARLEATLEQAGLLRAAPVKLVAVASILAAGFIVELMALMRLERGLSLNRPVTFLVIEMLIFAGVVLLAARARVRARSGRAVHVRFEAFSPKRLTASSSHVSACGSAPSATGATTKPPGRTSTWTGIRQPRSSLRRLGVTARFKSSSVGENAKNTRSKAASPAARRGMLTRPGFSENMRLGSFVMAARPSILMSCAITIHAQASREVVPPPATGTSAATANRATVRLPTAPVDESACS